VQPVSSDTRCHSGWARPLQGPHPCQHTPFTRPVVRGTATARALVLLDLVAFASAHRRRTGLSPRVYVCLHWLSKLSSRLCTAHALASPALTLPPTVLFSKRLSLTVVLERVTADLLAVACRVCGSPPSASHAQAVSQYQTVHSPRRLHWFSCIECTIFARDFAHE
jgi:hypothetical protein